MTDYTPEQLAWAARLLCVATQVDPIRSGQLIFQEDARRLLDELARQEVVCTDRFNLARLTAYRVSGRWQDAPICPNADR